MCAGSLEAFVFIFVFVMSILSYIDTVILKNTFNKTLFK